MSMHPDDDKTQTHVVLSSGTMVSHYRIIEKIGAGGMGEVYLAEDTKLHRKVALKFLPLHLCQDSECRARFTREAEAAAQLDHPNIVAVHEVGEYHGRPYFSMQHVEGQSLKEVIAGKTLPLERIIEIGIQVCDGLQAAHEKGITHRDIKPSNILIDAHGRARIVDFGLASVMGTDHLTKTGSTLGTIGYMSPEQVRGEAVDHRTDLFSLGAVLYELITGHSPFKCDSEAATLHAITDANPEPLARFRRDVPLGLQATIDKALDKRVATRYQHADELSADLKRLSATASSMPGMRKPRIRIVVPSLVILGVVVAALVLKPWRFEISPTHETQAATNWLAVMYFDNMADPADSKRLGEIATNLLITGLSQSENLNVMSSQRLYDLLKQMGKEGAKSIDRATASQIARKAEAKWMLTGSILQSEPRLVLTAQLIDVDGGGVVASQRVTGNPGEDIFAVIDRLTEDVKKCSAMPAALKGESPVRVADITTSSPEAYRQYLDGLEYRDKFYSTDALRSFHKAVELDSTFADAYFWVAYLSNDDQEKDWAMAKVEQYLDRASERVRRMLPVGRPYLKNDLQGVTAECRRYLDRYPDDKGVWFWLGNATATLGGNLDSALTYFQRSLALDPSYKVAWNSLAYVYSDLGRQDDAIKAINKYVSLVPDEANPYDSRGDLYALAGKLDSAIVSYQKALRLKPDFLMSLKKLGYMYMFLGRYEEADSTFRIYFSALDKPMRGHWRASLTLVPRYRGRFHEGLRIADECMAANKVDGLEGTNWVMYELKSDMYDCLAQPDSALAMVRVASQLAAKDARATTSEVRSWEAVLSYKAGDTVASRALLDQLEQAAGSGKPFEVASYWDAKGQIALHAKDYSNAIEYLKKKDSAEAIVQGGYTLARAYLESGDWQRAIELLEKKLIQYDENRAIGGPTSVKGYYLLGQAYDEIGESDKARDAFEKFLTIWKDADPGLREVDDAKARLARLKAKS